MMTVNNASACRPPAMPQDQRRRSCDEYDVISSDFPPPSLKPANNPDQDKSKKKKWSIGGLFRRKKKVSDTDSSSPIEDDEDKKGFLERRRARKRKNRGSKDVTGSFEHVIINRQSQVFDHPTEPRDVSNERIARSHESLAKRDANQVRGSSVSLEGVGKKGGRLKVKARVEASRERLKGDSSSDDGGNSSRQSSSSIQRLKCDENISKDGSLSRRTRAARTERYKKRLSRDDESLRDFHVPSRISRSDEKLSNKKAEKPTGNNRWTAKVVYYESSDYDTKYTAITKSATPSPIQSPKVRPKNALHYTASAPVASNYVTYPPSHSREGVAGSHQELRSQHRHLERVPLNQRYPDITPPRLPKSSSDMIAKPAQFPSSIQRNCPSWGQEALNMKSASYDCNVNSIHFVNNQIIQPHPTDENVLVVQFPLSRPAQKIESKIKMGVTPLQNIGKQQNPPPPPPRDPHRRLMPANGYQHESSPRPMSYAFEDRNPVQSKYPEYQEFGSSSSAFQRVPKPQTVPIDFEPSSSINRHHRSSSDNHIPSRLGVKQSPPMARKVESEQSQRNRPGLSDYYPSSPPTDPFSSVPCHYQYYTDQQPRSRKPIHIAYQGQKGQNDPYLSDSQMVLKPPLQQTSRTRPPGVQNAADFWKQKDQESTKKIHISEGSPKLVQRHLLNIPQNGKSRSNSPLKDCTGSIVSCKLKLPPLTMPVRGVESSVSHTNQLSPRDGHSPRTPTSKRPGHNELGIPVFDSLDVHSNTKHPLSMLEEKQESSEQVVSSAREKLNNPPTPPTRRDSKVNAVTTFENFDIFSDNENKKERRKSSNLEEALNELEAIYKSLRLGEENYLEKVAKEQAVYENNRLDPSNWNAWVQSRGFESDSSFNYSRSSLDSVDSVDSPRMSSSRRPGIPDRVTDDMAYRRLNKKDRAPPHEQEVISQAGSFLLVSPTLSPPPFIDSPPVPQVIKEPDVEKDDVVYRNIKHVNNTLKCLDPQPPFGIPLGPITPAPNSDYLHVSPKETYRPSFKPRKIPDVVTDDLAFRNLRKDNNKEPLFTAEDTSILDSPTLKKKRAVRSLSANLLSIIQRESLAMKNNNNKLFYNNNVEQGELEKSHSFSDVTDALDGISPRKNGHVVNNQREINIKKNLSGEDSDTTPRVSRVFSIGTSSPLTATSTETLTGSKNSLWAPEIKTGNGKLSKSSSPRLSLTPERRHTTDIVNIHTHKSSSPSIYVPAKSESFKNCYYNNYTKSEFQRSPTPDAHNISYQANGLKEERNPGCNENESELLAVLAREAKEASEQLSKELNELTLEDNTKTYKNDSWKPSNVEKDPVKSDAPSSMDITFTKQHTAKPLHIGKIIPHKPVKLNTFYITEDDQLESKQTVITSEPAEIEGSKSMTDLLKELTRSLDIDFGNSPNDVQNESPVNEEDIPSTTDTISIEETPYTNETKSKEVIPSTNETKSKEMTFDECVTRSTDVIECEDKYFSSHEDVSDERFSSPEKFLQSFIAESIENQKLKPENRIDPLLKSLPEDTLEHQKEINQDTTNSAREIFILNNEKVDNCPCPNSSSEEIKKSNEDVPLNPPVNMTSLKGDIFEQRDKIDCLTNLTEENSLEVDEVLNTFNEESSKLSEIPTTSSPLPNRFPLKLPEDEEVIVDEKFHKREFPSHSSDEGEISKHHSRAGEDSSATGESRLAGARPRMADEGTKTMADPSTLLLVCMACANLLAGLELDFLTILGLVLAIACLFLFLIL